MDRSIILIGFLVFATAYATTEEGPSGTESEAVEVQAGENVVTSRSINLEENKIESKSLKRHPKFGFNIPFPMPGGVVAGDPNATQNPDTHVFGGQDQTGSTTATLGTTAVLIKGGILSGLMALKAAILPPLFLGALILFLIAGAGFFTCSIVNCGRIVGDFVAPISSPGFGGPHSFHPFNRNGLDEYEHHRPIFHAIDEAYKKFDNQY